MLRSEINQIIKKSKSYFNKNNFFLPAWSNWPLNEWKKNINFAKIAHQSQIGWDITDFGKNNFHKEGAVLFSTKMVKRYNKLITYSEKLLLLMPNQKIPFHFHKKKTEDIINRCNGVLEMGLYASDSHFKRKKDSFILNIDSIPNKIKPNEKIFLHPGQSITIKPYLCHYLKSSNKNKKTLIVGEVSSLNDDNTDNYFPDKNLRFTKIEEDEEIRIPLWRELSILF